MSHVLVSVNGALLSSIVPYEFMCQMFNEVVDLIPVVHHTARPVKVKDVFTHFIRDKTMMTMAMKLVMNNIKVVKEILLNNQ